MALSLSVSFKRRRGATGASVGGKGEPLPEISVQRETRVRCNDNKKKSKEADFPPEAPETSSHKYEAANAEHSLHDLSSKCPKECSLIKISKSCDRGQNDGGANQVEKHSARGIPKLLIIFSCSLKKAAIDVSRRCDVFSTLAFGPLSACQAYAA